MIEDHEEFVLMQRQWMAEVEWQFRNPVIHERFSEILMSMYQLMACHQHTFMESDLRRVLKEMERYQMDSLKINIIQELDATLLAEAGRLSHAYDMLSQPLGLSSTRQKHSALLGILRKHQLYAILDEEGQRMADSSERWQHNPQIWGRVGRNGRQLCPQAKNHFKQALLEHPSDTCIYISLIELLSTEGEDQGTCTRVYRMCCSPHFNYPCISCCNLCGGTGALDVGLSLLESRLKANVVDYDANAQYLMLLLKKDRSTVAKDFDNVQKHYVKEATECCIRLLDIDPGSGEILQLVCKFMSLYGDVHERTENPSLINVVEKVITSAGVVECRASQFYALVEIEKMMHALCADSPMDWTKCVGLLAHQTHWNADMFLSDNEYWPLQQRWHLHSLGILWETAIERRIGLYTSRKLAQGALDESGSERNTWLKTRLQQQLHQLAKVHDILF